MPGAGANAESAAVFVHNIVRDPETEAGAGGFLGGEEGLVEAAKCGGRHAGAVIGDGETNSASSVVWITGRAHTNKKLTG